MVKLGSLYRAGTPLQANGYNPPPPLLRERLEFNHKVQEQRLLAEERKDWDRISPNHNQLQAKVEQLYRLDRILQEESGTLQSLQQDKVRRHAMHVDENTTFLVPMVLNDDISHSLIKGFKF